MNRILLLACLLASPPLVSADWPGFRGQGNSHAPTAQLPLQWSSDSNLLWRLRLPGTGQSSPVVWKDTAFVTSVVGERKESLVIQSLNTTTGEERWRHSLPSALPEVLSDTRSQAAPTPVVNESGVFAFFESGDLLHLNHQGKTVWHRRLAEELGAFTGNHGLGGSLALAPGLLLVPLDQESPSSLLALDPATGATRWRTPRPKRVSWSTPLVVIREPITQILQSGGGTLSSYAAEDGRLLWELDGLVRNNVPSPTLLGTTLVVPAGGKGSSRVLDWPDPTLPPKERWLATEVANGFASPLLHHDRVYFLATASVLHVHDAATGRELFSERLPEAAWASPIAQDDRVYLFGQQGATVVLQAADTFLPLTTNLLTLDGRLVGVAVADNLLLLRAERELLAVGQK